MLVQVQLKFMLFYGDIYCSGGVVCMDTAVVILIQWYQWCSCGIVKIVETH